MAIPDNSSNYDSVFFVSLYICYSNPRPPILSNYFSMTHAVRIDPVSDKVVSLCMLFALFLHDEAIVITVLRFLLFQVHSAVRNEMKRRNEKEEKRLQIFYLQLHHRPPANFQR